MTSYTGSAAWLADVLLAVSVSAAVLAGLLLAGGLFVARRRGR